MLSSLLFCRCCCRRCSLVVAAPIAAFFADPATASSLRVPRTFGILGSLGMPFCRGRHLIRVSRPICSPSRHTPGRMRFSVPGGRIRVRRAYLLWRTRTQLRSPLASKHLRAYAQQDLWQTRGFGVASPWTPGDTLCIRSSAWIRILMTFPGCPCLVSLMGLSTRAGYPSLYKITTGLHGQESTRRTPGRSVAIAMTPGYLSCPGITQLYSFYPWASVPPWILDPFPTCSLISTPFLILVPPPDLPTGGP